MSMPLVARIFLVATSALVPAPLLAQADPQATEESRVQKLEAQIQALQAQVDELKKQVTKPLPSWKGAPELSDKDAGWSFKPRGRVHYDVGYIGVPGAYAVNRSLGFNTRIRRVRLGAEGSMPGGFAYKVEVDFANSNVGFGDVLISYTPKNKNWTARLGNFETLNGLEQITSSNNVTFLERTQINDAFLNSRRLGAAFALLGEDEAYRIEAGAFTAHSIDASFDNDGWIGAARAVYAPEIEGGRLHFGVNYQHREFQSNSSGVASVSTNAPSINQFARYRARPFLQTTDVRFVDTGSFAAKGDDIIGLELAGIFENLYFTGEAQWNRVRTYRPGDTANGRDAFFNDIGITPANNPTFFGAYGEIGYFITGETRAYKDNIWGRTKVLNPINKGGSGAWQVAARFDYLDLDSNALKNAPTNNFSSGIATPASLASRLGRGGTQTGYLVGLNWYPIDYIRLMLNYIHIDVEGGPLASTVKPLSTRPIDKRSYSTDAVAFRAQLEF